MGIFSEIDMDKDTEIAPFDLDEAELAELESEDNDQEQDDNVEVLSGLNEQQDNDCVQDVPKVETAEDESDDDTDSDASEAQTKKEFEEQEAKRKADWEAQQEEKLEAEMMAWETAVAVSDQILTENSLKRIGDEAERLTRRNMKICVAEHIQTKCLSDIAFSRQVMHPRKSMINCLKYITRHALEYIKQDMEDNGEEQEPGSFGGDVPDGVCFKWAEDYFNDLEAKEDHVNDEKFVEKFYNGRHTKSKKAVAKKPPKKIPNKVQDKKETVSADSGQLTLENQMSLEDLAS